VKNMALTFAVCSLSLVSMDQAKIKQWLRIDYVAFVFNGPYAGNPVALSPDFKLVEDKQEARPFYSRERAEEYLSDAKPKLKTLSPDRDWRVEEGRDETEHDQPICYFICGKNRQ